MARGPQTENFCFFPGISETVRDNDGGYIGTIKGLKGPIFKNYTGLPDPDKLGYFFFSEILPFIPGFGKTYPNSPHFCQRINFFKKYVLHHFRFSHGVLLNTPVLLQCCLLFIFLICFMIIIFVFVHSMTLLSFFLKFANGNHTLLEIY